MSLKMKKFLKVFMPIFIIIGLPSLALGADLDSVVSKISSTAITYMRVVGVLIIIGLAIYIMKNYERLKEIFVMCLTIFIGAIILINADSVSSFFFSS